MKGYDMEKSDLELESFIRNLNLRGSINNLETSRTQSKTISHGSNTSSTINCSHSTSSTLDSKEEVRYQFFRQDNHGDTQLHMAIALNQVETSLTLIHLAPHSSFLDIPNDDLQTALHVAVLAKEPSIVRRLVLANANPCCRTATGNTPLHLACAVGDLACARALVEPLTNDEKSWVAGDVEERLAPNAQNLEIKNFVGKTCLHVAVSSGNQDITQLLLRRGANIDTRENLGGRTALHLAVEYRCWPIVLLLVNLSPESLHVPALDGTTPLQMLQDMNATLAENVCQTYSIREEVKAAKLSVC